VTIEKHDSIEFNGKCEMQLSEDIIHFNKNGKSVYSIPITKEFPEVLVNRVTQNKMCVKVCPLLAVTLTTKNNIERDVATLAIRYFCG
jgi:hypothetical protein